MPTLTKTLLKSIEPRETVYEVRDDRTRGLLLRVEPSGSMSFYVEYARGKRLRLGSSKEIEVDVARELALGHLATASRGETPLSAKKVEKARREEEAKKARSDVTFLTFVDTVFEPWAKQHLRTSKKLIERLRSNAKRFHPVRLRAISCEEFEKWRTSRLKAGKKRSTVNRDLDDVRGVLSKALEWEYISDNPLARVKKLKVDKGGVVRFLNHEEKARLLTALDDREQRIKESRTRFNQWRAARNLPLLPSLHNLPFADHLKPMVLVALHTGIRQGELFSLEWDDIDLSQKRLSIRGEVSKNLQTRHIPLNAIAAETLRNWKEQGSPSRLVFPNKHGDRFDTVKTAWNATLDAAKISSFRWHDLRHTFASRLVMSGVDLNTVRELMGHADYQMTLRYAHLAPEHKAAAVEKLVAA